MKRRFEPDVIDLTREPEPSRKKKAWTAAESGKSAHKARGNGSNQHHHWLGFRNLNNWGTPRRHDVSETHDFSEFPGNDVFTHPSDNFRMLLNPNPDDFQIVAQELSASIPQNIVHTGGSEWSRLTGSILREYSRRQQTLETMVQKIELWKEMYRVIRREFDCGLCIFGSTFNGFGGKNCDVDMCLFPFGADGYQDKQKLNIVRQLLRKYCRHFIHGNIELIPAKVPILKFKDKAGDLEVDLSVDNPTSIRNTHLLYYYSRCDYRVRPLVLAVKIWAKSHGINEARNQTLSSYSLTLMMIHYLQRTTPPVLPCLHNMYPNIFNPDSNIFNLDYTDTPAFRSDNTQSLGSLIAGFFSYYSGEGFDTRRDVASVRTGRILDGRDCEEYARRNKNGPGQWTANILIEEPFDRTNAARAVCSADKWKLVKSVFKETKEFLKKSRTEHLSFHDLLSSSPR